MLNVSRQFGAKATNWSKKFTSSRLSLTIIYVALLLMILLISSAATRSIFGRHLDQRFDLVRNGHGVVLIDRGPVPSPADVQSDLLLSMLIVNGLLLVGAGFASYFLAEATIKPLEEANKKQRTFLSDASHELRTPLAVLRIDLENRILEAVDESRKQELQMDLDEVLRMSSLVDDVLWLSRTDEGQEVAANEAVNLTQLLSTCTNRLKPLADKKKITFKLDLPEGENMVWADAKSISRVLENLVKNAIQYNKEGGEIILTLVKAGNKLQLKVTDTGIGMNELDLAHIFDRFYRADGSRSRETGGSGLGLAISKTIVENYGGKILANSVLGAGTTLTVEWPIYSS